MIEVRDGNAGDIAAIMPIMADAFAPNFGEQWTAAQCISALSLPCSSLLLAYFDGVLAGFALSRWVLNEEELLMIGVNKPHQQNGLGSFIIRHIIARGRNNNRTELFLEVRSNNTARQFYYHLGFQEVGIRKNYYMVSDGQSIDAITMQLIL